MSEQDRQIFYRKAMAEMRSTQGKQHRENNQARMNDMPERHVWTDEECKAYAKDLTDQRFGKAI